ncbi:probable peptidoglycan muropeptide transporter SLC46 [Ochlerotatus camptorhynchus]|uniref:probable peptidoglycan muropeptide transporter SLC46 n=1 Tax=Ochlerotatus camptorhynchus TaxID=644619 RepID=UPI0031D1215B
MEDPGEESNLVVDGNAAAIPEEGSRPPGRGLFILEPPIFLISFALNVSTAVFTDQLVYQACVVSLGINQTECDKLGKEYESPEVQALEARVQPYSADILMAESLADSILPAFMNLFIGPWSDRFGRKPVLLLTFIGCTLSHLLITVICALSSWYRLDPWYYAISFVPSALSGATCTMLTSVFCYIADVTSEQERGNKMSVMEAALYSGMLVGNISSSFILRLTNAFTVFAISTGSSMLAVLYIAFSVKESVQITEEDRCESCCSKLRFLFRPRMVLDTFKTCFSWRSNYGRAIILIGILTLGGNIFAIESNNTVFFLFVRKQFNWAVRKYSFYSSTETVLLVMGNLLATYILERLIGLTEAGIASIGFFSWMVNSIAIAVASEPWHLYLAIAICTLKGVTDPMTRAFISNGAPPEAIGSIFSFSTTFEALMPLGAAPLYTIVYKHTLEYSPGTFSWISAGVYGLCYCLTMSVCILQSMSSNSHYPSID